MRWIIAIVLALCSTSLVAQQEAEYVWVNEVGLVFPIKNNAFKDYLVANGITSLPITTGLGTGVQLGRHCAIAQPTTLGLVLNGNMFISNAPGTKCQVYQVATFLTGRIYFGNSWHKGLFAELAGGLEASAASFFGNSFSFQANIASRVGAGYNIAFNSTATVGVALTLSPTALSSDYLSSARLVINMLW